MDARGSLPQIEVLDAILFDWAEPNAVATATLANSRIRIYLSNFHFHFHANDFLEDSGLCEVSEIVDASRVLATCSWFGR